MFKFKKIKEEFHEIKAIAIAFPPIWKCGANAVSIPVIVKEVHLRFGKLF